MVRDDDDLADEVLRDNVESDLDELDLELVDEVLRDEVLDDVLADIRLDVDEGLELLEADEFVAEVLVERLDECESLELFDADEFVDDVLRDDVELGLDDEVMEVVLLANDLVELFAETLDALDVDEEVVDVRLDEDDGFEEEVLAMREEADER